MDYYKITKKLIGPIKPVGETNEDERRMQNLIDTCNLIDSLLSDLHEVASLHDRFEYSVKRAGTYAKYYTESKLKF